MSGLFSAWMHVASWGALARTDYGRVLILKVVLVGAMGVLGSLNWRFFGARVGEATGVLALRRATRLEIALGLMVLLATSVLVALATPAAGF
jgi:putative copper export protein